MDEHVLHHLEELKPDLAAFKTAKHGLDNAIAEMTTQIANATTERAKKGG